MSDDQPDVRPEDALDVARNGMKRAGDAEEIAQRALAKIQELEQSQSELLDRMIALELRYQEVEEDRGYDDLDTDGRVGRVREHAFERAVDGHGRAALDYNDVMWSVFDGEPSADHCYKLMRLAAGVDGDGNEIRDVPGFSFNDSTRPMKLLVDADEARRGAAFSSANKTISEGGRSG